MNKLVSEATVEELQIELARKKAGSLPTGRPAKLKKTDVTNLEALADKIIADIHEKGYSDGDYKTDIFNAVMTGLYGPDFEAWREQVVKHHTEMNKAKSELL